MNLYLEAGRLKERGAAFAIATIVEVKGSTPRNTAKMIVHADGRIMGTIGGGLAEAFVIREAIAAISENCSKMVEYVLDHQADDGIQMLCGGKLTVFIEVSLVRPRLVMIGAGHVGLAVAHLAEFLDFALVIMDDRPEFANREKYPLATEIICDSDWNQALTSVEVNAATYLVIATADADYLALKSVIQAPAAYIGMIGSKRKVELVLSRLREEGVPRESLDKVFAPVGLDLGAETPEEIALSILAEILKLKNGKTGRSLREVKR